MSVQAYPLHWPQGFPRAKYRESGRFKSSYNSALDNVVKSLKLFASDSGKKLEHAIASSNMTLTGLTGNDPGVAVWFVWDGMQVCIPVDRYSFVASNLQAIHHIIEARRVELRHGTLALVRATFTGFLALPAPAGKHWRDILGFSATVALDKGHVEEAFKRLARDRHPDKGGATDAMAELNAARETALREIGA